MSALTTTVHKGPEIAALAWDLARLRLQVFRDWPYLYEGSEPEEAEYLQELMASDDAICVAVTAGAAVVGVSTGLPLKDAHAEFRDPVAEFGLDPEPIFYCAETVIAAAHRGQGVYRTLFEARETHARSLGCTEICFCSVDRPMDHPQRPAGAAPLDPVWRRYRYAPVDGLKMRFTWTDVGSAAPTEKTLQVWSKRL